MKCMCPKCGEEFEMEEGYEEEGEGEEEMESMEGGEPEDSDIVVKEVDVSGDKEKILKKKLMELGKFMASLGK